MSSIKKKFLFLHLSRIASLLYENIKYINEEKWKRNSNELKYMKKRYI